MRYYTYQLFLERHDIETSQKEAQLADEIIDACMDNVDYCYEQFKKGKSYECSAFTYNKNGVKINITLWKKSGSYGTFNPDTNTLNIGDPDICSNIELLDKGILVDEAYQKLKNPKNWIKPKWTMVHELTHYFDNIKHDLPTHNHKLTNAIKDDKFRAKLEDVLYFNSNPEYNAYFIEALNIWYNNFLTSSKKYDTFENFETDFLKHFPDMSNYNEEYKKRILKRVYAIYDVLKPIITSETNIKN